MEIAVLGTITSITEKIIVNSIQSSFNLVKFFVSSHHEQINEVLAETDLICKLQVIESLLCDIRSESKSVQISLKHVSDVVSDINVVLNKINEKIKRHQLKYFSNWRSLNYEIQMKELRKNIKLLDTRYQMFLEIIKVHK
jgi:ribosomal protein S8